MSTKIIKINRGDSFEFIIDLSYTLEATDAVYFSLMLPHQSFEEALLIMGYTVEDLDEEGNLKIQLTPNDTRCLQPGVYYYTVKLQRGGTLGIINDLDDSTEVRTIIERTKFIVNE